MHIQCTHTYTHLYTCGLFVLPHVPCLMASDTGCLVLSPGIASLSWPLVTCTSLHVYFVLLYILYPNHQIYWQGCLYNPVTATQDTTTWALAYLVVPRNFITGISGVFIYPNTIALVLPLDQIITNVHKLYKSTSDVHHWVEKMVHQRHFSCRYNFTLYFCL